MGTHQGHCPRGTRALLEQSVSYQYGKGRPALRIVDGNPFARPYRGDAEYDEADARTAGQDGESLKPLIKHKSRLTGNPGDERLGMDTKLNSPKAASPGSRRHISQK